MIFMYIGEFLNEIKFGNGMFLLIFVNIVSVLLFFVG